MNIGSSTPEESLSNGFNIQNPIDMSINNHLQAPKKKRNLPGNPDPEAEVIALSPKTLMATNRFLCEICGKGFQRDQNLQLHRRGHNLPWKLKQRTSKEVKKRVYICPEKSCVHHHASRALGDLTGIKKHFCRKHGEKKWKCDKCAKRYAVQSDWKAHSKTCGTREYKCDCGTLFSRRDSFITHRAFCDALAEETARVNAVSNVNNFSSIANNLSYHHLMESTTQLGPNNMAQHFSSIFKPMSNINELSMDQKQGLSFWMGTSLGQGSHHQQQQQQQNDLIQEIHQLGTLNSESLYNDHNTLVSISCSNPPPQSQLNWVFGNKLISSPINGHEIPLSSTVNAPSLFSTQHQVLPSSTNMSATALLQKAAQIGATNTTTTTNPLFFDSFEMKGEDKYCGLYVNSSTITNNLGSDDVESSANDIHVSSLSQMYPPAKRRHVSNEENKSATTAQGGRTRDFLGVGVQSIPSINQWVDLRD
ncbi:hypothetical protein ACFE04_018203 [Oxalis oulophora]